MSTTTGSIDTFVSEEQAAEILHARRQTLRAWRVRGRGPVFFKIVGRVCYKREDLESWIEGCRIDPSDRHSRARRHRVAVRPRRISK